MIHKILVAVDGSAVSRHALAMACELASRFEATVRLVHVVEPVPLPPFAGPAVGGIYESLDDAGVSILREAQERCEQLGVHATAELLSGMTTETILAAAERFDADLVVAGSRGRGLVTRMLLGSISAQLTHRCLRPLLIVHPPGDAHARASTGGAEAAPEPA